MPDGAKKVYVLDDKEEKTLFETHFDELPLVGDFIDRPDDGKYIVTKRIHKLNTRGWSDSYAVVVQRA
ncbi:MAG: hypothetical protein IH851_09540 [Armatimonadetes bacterium]|nr:hypothetical protein [Armatimonadota bacterium]